ncbi:MAG: 4-deoxy-4-formamido-L-arabinose-phosphoundecaprenol deformylase [Proteobacteria bacterium]|nr:4-deoxy-4-formamido-L-arabinose-phosphoundecaprenol deformylase [Pseudomonadota bacterium]
MQIALKVDVDTYRGTLEGVPGLVAELGRRAIAASFYFSLGPDHTGWALRRVFRPGFLSKVRRTSVVSHYGVRTLLYGVLLPGPHIGRRAAAVLRATRDAGHETGIHCYDHVYWQDNVARRDAAWTERQVRLAAEAYREVFGAAARAHCAAGWQLNATLFALEDALGLDYASDTRGSHPFLPAMDAVRANCPQLPTTLPTLDELVGIDGLDVDGAIDRLLDATATPNAAGAHVFTLHAELEGQQFRAPFMRLLDTWRARGVELVTLARLRRDLDPARLPRHRVELGEIAGRSGVLARQGPPVAA